MRSSNDQQTMIGTIELHALVEVIDDIEAVACEERNDRIEALLKMLVREHQARQVGRVTICTKVAGSGLACYLALDFRELILNLPLASRERSREGWIELLQTCREPRN